MSAITRVDCISVQIFILLSLIYSVVPTVTGVGKATVGKSVLTPRVFSFANVTAAENFSAFDSVVQKENISLSIAITRV